MSHETAGPEFIALTDDQQAATVGGDGGFFYAAGWVVGYAYACTLLAIQAQTMYMNRQPVFLFPT